MTYKITIYGKRIKTEEFEDIHDAINEVHYLTEYKLAKGKISGFCVMEVKS